MVLVIIGSICAIIIVLGLIYNCWQRRLPKMKNMVSEHWTGGECGWTLTLWDGGDWKVKRDIVFPCSLTGHSWIHCWSSKGAHSGVREMQTCFFLCSGQLVSTARDRLGVNLPFTTGPAKSSVILIVWSDCASQQH